MLLSFKFVKIEESQLQHEYRIYVKFSDYILKNYI